MPFPFAPVYEDTPRLFLLPRRAPKTCRKQVEPASRLDKVVRLPQEEHALNPEEILDQEHAAQHKKRRENCPTDG